MTHADVLNKYTSDIAAARERAMLATRQLKGTYPIVPAAKIIAIYAKAIAETQLAEVEYRATCAQYGFIPVYDQKLD